MAFATRRQGRQAVKGRVGQALWRACAALRMGGEAEALWRTAAVGTAWRYAGGAVPRAALPAKLASESRLLLGLRRACYGCAVAVCMRGVELRAAGPGSACLHAAWSTCVCLQKRKVSTARCLACELACRVCAV